MVSLRLSSCLLPGPLVSNPKLKNALRFESHFKCQLTLHDSLFLGILFPQVFIAFTSRQCPQTFLVILLGATVLYLEVEVYSVI